MTCVSGLGRVRRGGRNSDTMHNLFPLYSPGRQPFLSLSQCGVPVSNCSAGYFCPPDALSVVALPCPAGQFSATGASQCTNCSAGTYSSQPGKDRMLCSDGVHSSFKAVD